jgi:hypothetical protein
MANPKEDFTGITGKPESRQTFPTEIPVGDVLRLTCKLL